MIQAWLVVGTLVCAVQAIRAARLLESALWLAGVSALVSLALYLLGAPQVAVIELSVGAGLVTVLFVFAINIAGEQEMPLRSVVPQPLAWIAVTLAGVLALSMLTLAPAASSGGTALTVSQVFWGLRWPDALVQVALIVAGVLGMLGILAEGGLSRGASISTTFHVSSEPPVEVERVDEEVPV
ncbi:MAG: hypothetical protein Kow0047_01960 [Anaerolineae bacterium]